MKKSLGKKNQTNQLVMSGMMIALVFIATFLPKIPVAGGYLNLGDGMIVFAGFLCGPITGMVSGALGSAFSDVAAGYYLWVPITFFVKGIEGLVAGYFVRKSRDELIPLSTFLTIAIMPVGYFLGEWLILSLVDSTLGITTAITNLYFNGLQGLGCFALALMLIFALKRFKM